MNSVQGPGGRGRELGVDIKETLLTMRMEELSRPTSKIVVCSHSAYQYTLKPPTRGIADISNSYQST